MDINEKIAGLEEQIRNLQNNIIAVDGALQLARQIRDELEQENAEEADEKGDD